MVGCVFVLWLTWPFTTSCSQEGPPGWAVRTDAQAIQVAEEGCPDVIDPSVSGHWQVVLKEPYWTLWHFDEVDGFQNVIVDGRTGGVSCPDDP